MPVPGRTRGENIETRYNPQPEIKEYKDALSAFTEAMGRLTEAWERLEFAGANVPDKGTPYPFNESFDELYHGVLGWAHDIHSAQDPAEWNVASDAAPVTASKIAADAQAAVARYRKAQKEQK